MTSSYDRLKPYLKGIQAPPYGFPGGRILTTEDGNYKYIRSSGSTVQRPVEAPPGFVYYDDTIELPVMMGAGGEWTTVEAVDPGDVRPGSAWSEAGTSPEDYQLPDFTTSPTLGTAAGETTLLPALFRKTQTTTASAGQVARIYATELICYPKANDNPKSPGGFLFESVFRWQQAVAVSGSLAFCGMRNDIANPSATTDPRTIVNSMGFCVRPGGTNELYVNAAANISAYPIVISDFGINTWLRLVIDARKVGCTMKLTNLVTGVSTTKKFPANFAIADTVGLGGVIYHSNNATALAVRQDYSMIQVTTEF
jgi:hypothetical protein